MIAWLVLANITSVSIGFLLDHFLGDPAWKWHPVRPIGMLVFKLEKILYKDSVFMGGILVVSLLVIVFGFYIILIFLAWNISLLFYIIVSSLGVWSGLSVKDMNVQVSRITQALENNDLSMARQMTALVVSRDTAKMDENKVISSAVETVAENFTDAVMSPLFYGFAFGGAGVIFFKCISTLDSMIGYKSRRYIKFGRVAARIDDIMGFIPARIMIIPVLIASAANNLDMGAAWRCFRQQRKDHASPNAGHGISAFAGALNVTLGGPTSYGGVIYDKPLILGGNTPLSIDTIDDALLLYRKSALVAVILGMFIIATSAHFLI